MPHTSNGTARQNLPLTSTWTRLRQYPTGEWMQLPHEICQRCAVAIPRRVQTACCGLPREVHRQRGAVSRLIQATAAQQLHQRSLLPRLAFARRHSAPLGSCDVEASCPSGGCYLPLLKRQFDHHRAISAGPRWWWFS